MPYTQLYYHLVWGTKYRAPRLVGAVEAAVQGYLRSKALELEAQVYALNGVADHIHMVVSIPPKIAVATFIGQVKGSASTKLNKSGLCEEPFFWQEEYGAFSFDRKRLPSVISYVERQKQHHADKTTIVPLERSDDPDSSMIREEQMPYAYEEIPW